MSDVLEGEAKGERDAGGRFVKGAYKGGPGRKPVATERSYLETLATACNPEKWKSIVTRAVSDAELGCDKARNWLARYILGDPGKLVLKLSDLAEKPAAQPLTADSAGGKQVLAELLLSEDPRIRLGAARVLLDLQAGSEGVQAFLKAVEAATGAEGAYDKWSPSNKWRPEGED